MLILIWDKKYILENENAKVSMALTKVGISAN